MRYLLCIALWLGLPTAALAANTPPPPDGYFTTTAPAGTWNTLPTSATCKASVNASTWEPRQDNYVPNHTVDSITAIHQSLESRPKDSNYDSRWNSWLQPRIGGQYKATTDKIFQWAACKWGIPDNVLRSMAVRESTWYQREVYPSGRCVWDYGCGDAFPSATADSQTYCDGVDQFGYNYQADFGQGLCPKTWSITGIMAWDAPAWEAPNPPYAGNQNGSFPFSRDSTAFAEDYMGSYLRGCYNGWIHWLNKSGGDLWGCVGSWYSGDWHSAAANGYISRVQNEINNHTWLQSSWPTNKPGCSSYGCPEGYK